jgi:hypothetical protein
VRRSAFVALLLVVWTALPAGALVTPTRVVGGSGEQYDPFVSGDLIAYTTYASKHSHAYVHDPSNDSTRRIEASGQGEANGFDPSSDKILFTQWDAATNGNLFFYDLSTKGRTKVPDVNTAYWEWDGRISSSFILFLRDRKTNGVWYGDVLLYRRATGATRTLKSYRWSQIDVLNTGSVGERYATWSVCGEDAEWCSAVVYDDVAKAVRTIPTKNGRRQYAPVVDELNGTVYFTRLGGSTWCRDVNVWRLPVDALGGAPTKVIALPDGADTGWTSSLSANEATGDVDYFLERYVCSKNTGDIYVAAGVDTIPTG